MDAPISFLNRLIFRDCMCQKTTLTKNLKKDDIASRWGSLICGPCHPLQSKIPEIFFLFSAINIHSYFFNVFQFYFIALHTLVSLPKRPLKMVKIIATLPQCSGVYNFSDECGLPLGSLWASSKLPLVINVGFFEIEQVAKHLIFLTFFTRIRIYGKHLELKINTMYCS